MFKNIRDKLPVIGSKKDIVCPKCLNKVTVDTMQTGQHCTGKIEGEFGDPKVCNFEFPLSYITRYGQYLPVPVQVFGWSNHGKTVFLDVLRLMLMEMHQLWPEYAYEAITEDALDKQAELRTRIKNGTMPPPTVKKDRDQNVLYIMQLTNMIRFGSRFLVIMDHAGERFNQFELETHEIPFLTHEDTTTLLIVSVPMLRGMGLGTAASDAANPKAARAADRDKGRSMDMLLKIYSDAMLKHEKQMERKYPLKRFIKPRRKLVVVLTMADKFISELPPRVQNYLASDSTWDELFVKNTFKMTADSVESYLTEMQSISAEIRDWLRNDIERMPGGRNLVSTLENTANNFDVSYTIISATGHDINDMHKGTEIAPKRVLDPFFWVLALQNRGIAGRI